MMSVCLDSYCKIHMSCFFTEYHLRLSMLDFLQGMASCYIVSWQLSILDKIWSNVMVVVKSSLFLQ